MSTESTATESVARGHVRRSLERKGVDAIVLVYGLLAYAAGVAALLYLIGFAGNVFVPTSVDVGRRASWAEAIVVDMLLLGAFAAQHSVMARRGFKRWWTRIVPPAAERSTYLLATSLVLLLLFLQWRPVTAPVAWELDGAAAAGLTALCWTGWALVLFSTFLIDHFELFGLRQVWSRLTGRAMRAPDFRTPLLYGYVRHPLYLGLLLGLWSVPRMTAGHLLFTLGFSVYIVVGIHFEERDLVAHFGERYRRYRTEVGMLLPWRRRAG